MHWKWQVQSQFSKIMLKHLTNCKPYKRNVKLNSAMYVTEEQVGAILIPSICGIVCL